jgi:Ni,Fe-hydrogenase maturation factor
MISFSDLLKNVSTAVPLETQVRDFLLNYLKENCNIILERKLIQVKKNTIELKISPTIKAKINPYYEDCLEKINNHLQEKEIKIRINKIV